jgi:TIR domain
MAKIAISYRRADSAPIAGRIRDRLAARYGDDSIFIDVYEIPIGSDFPEQVRKVWSKARVLLALIGPNWLRAEDQLSPRLALRYVALPALSLLVAHYLIVNALDLHAIYLRIVCFLIPMPFGASFFREARTKLLAAFAVGALLGLVTTCAMTISVALRYHQPIVPADSLEWLENLEYIVSIVLGFLAGNLLARLPRASSWWPQSEDWVLIEVATALEQRIPIIPVLVDGATMPSPRELPNSIRRITYLAGTEVQSGPDFDSHMARLIAGIDKILADSEN